MEVSAVDGGQLILCGPPPLLPFLKHSLELLPKCEPRPAASFHGFYFWLSFDSHNAQTEFSLLSFETGSHVVQGGLKLCS